MPKIIESLSEWRKIRKSISKRETIGFVPTMGNLHIGHISLLNQSRQQNDISILSIFVNPTQFNNSTDLKNYPRTLEEDKNQAEKAKVDYILIPHYQEIYPDNYEYKVSEEKISTILEGAFRPGHFSGMLTVVLKLLLLINPTRSYLGEKDYQQLQLIKGLAQAFFLETEIIGCPTIRNEFGLPYSSRNNRLTKEQYQQSQYFPKIFHSSKNCDEIKNELIQRGFEVEYIEEQGNRRFAAVKIGDVRLIDNIEIKS